ncbi:hypothetical protein [Methylomonas rhizoryzae]|uniref:hypothetical protein n=1 Tax=Methylomonas rhizoryzae TaxID=2608981 RepID=UPI001232215B|nr:hypothetical protein [Methylomonas rhizoryzae]
MLINAIKTGHIPQSAAQPAWSLNSVAVMLMINIWRKACFSDGEVYVDNPGAGKNKMQDKERD